jgi:ribosome biogenesis SPOUT family RNA methylase Rps3
MKYIIEHLESTLSTWCMFEYAHIGKIVGKRYLIFTNVKHPKNREKLSQFGKVYKESVCDLGLDNVCILDPKASKTLMPTDNGRFDYLIFGGILGDYPPQNRTGKALTKRLPKVITRNLKEMQMSTDTAVNVSKKIIEGMPFSKLKFIDKPEFKMEDGLSLELPYRYLREEGKPLMAPGLFEYLQNTQSF